MLPPLDAAICVWRAQAGDPIPSEGTLAVPLQLGGVTGPDPADPIFVADAVLGGHLRYGQGQAKCAKAPVPLQQLSGDFTLAMRVRPDGPWTLRFLASVIDNLDQPSELKHIMVHLVYDGQVMARVFDSSPQHAQVQVVSTTRLSVNSTYDVVVTWEGLLKRLRVYVDGNLEGTTTANVTRSVPTSSPLYLVHPTSISAHKLFAAAWDNRAWTAAEVEALNWSTTPPPPPPPPGVLRVLIDGAEHPGATVEIDGVPVLPEGTADKVVTVSTVR